MKCLPSSSLLIKTPGELNNTVFVEKTLGVDWGDETRWVLLGRTPQNRFYIIDSGSIMYPSTILRCARILRTTWAAML
ncbi:hypothetical protein ig2599ANME_0887 [groundwater metagenome]